MALAWAALALAWLLGVALQLQQAQPPSAMAAGMGACSALIAGLAWMALRRWAVSPAWRASRWASLCLAVVLAAWSLTQWRAEQRWRQQWPRDWAAHDVVLTGKVVGMPQVQTWGLGLTVEVDAIDDGGVRMVPGQPWTRPGMPKMPPGAVCPQRVSLVWTSRPASSGDGVPSLMPGQVWRWRVRMHQPDGLLNPGAYDAELAVFERGVRAQGTVRLPRSGRSKDGDDAQPILMRPPSWLDGQVIERLRTELRDRALRGIPDPQVAGLVIGLTIGEQSAIATNDWDTMRLTGTAHLAAISGLHITMMGWMVSLIVSWVWRRLPWLRQWRPAPVVAGWLGLGGALFYALLSGWGVPAQRTVLMLAVVTLLRVGGRRWPWPLSLLIAAVVVTLLDPWALLQAGFWLSFAAVGLLMLSGEDEAGDQSGPSSPWWRKLWRSFKALLRTQSVASIGLAPLSVVFFQSFSIVGLLANLVCIPLFTVIITPLAMMGLGWQGFWQPLVPVVHHTMAGLSWLGAHDWVMWQSAGVAFWASSLGLLAGACLLAPLPWRWRLLAAPAMLPLLWPSPLSQNWLPPRPGHVFVMAADIGQGSAIVVRTARHQLLFDTGPRTSPEMDAGRRVLVGLFRTLGIDRLDVLMLSHGDSDHIGGAASVLKAVNVDRVVSSLVEGHELRATPDRRGLVPPHPTCMAGQQWQWDGVHFQILHPTADELSQREALGDNALSCVLRIEAAGQGVLLTGDIEKAQEAALAERVGPRLKSDILLAPHHGSNTSSTEVFLAQVQPKMAVIQAGARNRYGHPAPRVLARYQALGIPVKASPDCGAWIWQSDEGSAQGHCWRALARRYWFHDSGD